MDGRPQTRYARTSDGVHIAYQVVGRGPLDLVLLDSWVIPLEARWDQPNVAHHLNRLAGFSRLIAFDRRGIGLSDRPALDATSTLEAWADDVVTVLNEVGSDRAAMMGSFDGGMAAMMFAATHPDRVAALVLVNTTARMVRDEEAPWGVRRERHEQLLGDVVSWYGSDDRSSLKVAESPVHPDPAFQTWWSRARRHQASPAALLKLIAVQWNVDLRPILGMIHVPTLVLHSRDEANLMLRVEHGRYLAQHIEEATLVELADLPHEWHASHGEALLDEVEGFLLGTRPPPDRNRVLATVLFVDIVGSTDQAVTLGDRAWTGYIERFRAAVRAELVRFGGREIGTRGDDFLATFDGPARAVWCAHAIVSAAAALGLDVRSGLHTGEIELLGDDIAGIAVHIGARIAESAGARQIVVSRTVVDLVAGSGLEFADLGEHELKGLPGSWQLFQTVA